MDRELTLDPPKVQTLLIKLAGQKLLSIVQNTVVWAFGLFAVFKKICNS